MSFFEGGRVILIVRKQQRTMVLDLKAPQGHTNAFIFFFCHVHDEENCLFLKFMIGRELEWIQSYWKTRSCVFKSLERSEALEPSCHGVSRFLDKTMAEVAPPSQALSLAHTFGFGIAVSIFLSLYLPPFSHGAFKYSLTPSPMSVSMKTKNEQG